MFAADDTIAILREWVAKAENDLIAAAQILKLGSEAPAETICFHSQQCVEKYLKATLVIQGVSVPKTHKIRMLMSMVQADSRPDLADGEQDRLTRYAADIRYPDAGLEITLREARKALAIARRVRRQIRGTLPKLALRRKRK